LPYYSQQYKKLYEDKKRQNKQLEKENESLRRQALLIPDRFHLNPRQLAIIEYIRKHPGHIKTKLISELQNSSQKNKSSLAQYGTFVTLLKEIKALRELNIIRIEKVHKQKHKLYLNENSLLLEIHTDLNNFKNSFDELLDKVSADKKWKECTSSTYWMERMDADRLLHYLLLIYQHVFSVYLTYILLKWSVELKNDEFLLNKIYSLILFTFIETQTEFAEKFNLGSRLPDFDKSTINDKKSPILYQMTSKSFLLDPYTLMDVIKEFHKFGLHLDILPLIDISWNIGLNLFKFIEGRFLREFEPQVNEALIGNWKRLLSFYLEQKSYIDPINPPPPPSRFRQTERFHRDKNSIRQILNQIIKSDHRSN
jgi:hypothetical protein